MTRIAVAVFVWVVIALYLLLIQPVLLLLVIVSPWLDPGRRMAGRVFRFSARLAIYINPLWDFHVETRAHELFHEPSVVVSNHESDADVFLSTLLPWDLKYLSKETIYDLPVMGWGMRMAGDVRVVRGERVSGRQALEACRTWLDKGVSVIFFPEGTRSRKEEMLPFKEGAFRLAIEAQVPIQPFVVAGTRNALPPGSLVFNKTRAVARILDPIPTAGLGLDDVTALTERVQNTIGAARTELRRELGLEG